MINLFENHRSKFDDDLPPPNSNRYEKWYYGRCYPSKYEDNQELPMEGSFLENSLLIIDCSNDEATSFINEYGNIINECELSDSKKLGGIYIYRVV